MGSVFTFSDKTLGTETPRPEGSQSHKKWDYFFSNVACKASGIDIHTQVVHIFLMHGRRVHPGRKVPVQFPVMFQGGLRSE